MGYIEILHAVERACSAFGSPAVAILLGVAAYRFNRLQVQFAASQMRTARYQVDLTAERLRRDLYDRRYAILEAAQVMVALAHGFPNREDKSLQASFKSANATLQHSRFLLDAELSKYLLEQTATVLRLINTVNSFTDKNAWEDQKAKGDAGTKYLEETQNLLKVSEDLPRRFASYLTPKEVPRLEQ